jgi:hypothetical protein
MEPFVIQHLALVVVARNHNPTIVNPDFLRTNHIVPDNWELGAPPLCVEPIASVTYATGVNITAQADRVSFTEPIAGKNRTAVVLPDIVTKYAETLRHVNYHALGINPTGHIVFGQDAVPQVREFIIKRFLAHTQWGEWKQPPMTAGVRLAFTVDPWIMNVSIDEGIVQLPGKPPLAAVVASGNFHKDLSGKTVEERLKDLLETLKQWNTALDHFANFVENALKP